MLLQTEKKPMCHSLFLANCVTKNDNNNKVSLRIICSGLITGTIVGQNEAQSSHVKRDCKTFGATEARFKFFSHNYHVTLLLIIV